jgi:transcriptional regulator with XRE-family HTH domain
VTSRRNRPDLAAILKARRKEMGLTLGDLGSALGLANGNFFGMVERNERMPSDERLLLLAKLLGLDGREVLAMKYQQARGTAAEVLLAPPLLSFPGSVDYSLVAVRTKRR